MAGRGRPKKQKLNNIIQKEQEVKKEKKFIVKKFEDALDEKGLEEYLNEKSEHYKLRTLTTAAFSVVVVMERKK